MEGFGLFMALVIAAFVGFVWYRLISKMGFPGWYTIGFFVPILGLGLLLYFAFTEWPIEKEVSELRFRAHMQPNKAPQVPNPMPGNPPGQG